jgi:hypothetical protein
MAEGVAGNGPGAGARLAPAAITAGCLSVQDPTPPPATAATLTLAITASCIWTVTSDQPWLTTASRPTAYSGHDLITYSVSANSTPSARTGRLTVTAGADSVQVTILQPGSGTCGYAVSPAAETVPSSAGSFGVSVSANCTWTASTDQPWLTITTGTSGTGNATITYAVTAHAGPAPRVGRLTVTGTGGSAQLTVTQNPAAAPSCAYSLLPTSQVAIAMSDDYTAALTAGCAWTASSDQPWLVVENTSGPGNNPIQDTIFYTVAALPGTTGRTGRITVTGAGGTVQLTVMQRPPAAVMMVASPNPVGWGSDLIIPGCEAIPNQRDYDEAFTESTGIAVTLTRRINRVNGSVFNDITINRAIPAGGSGLNVATWCFSSDATRTISSEFRGTDADGNAIVFVGPDVVLLSAADTF